MNNIKRAFIYITRRKINAIVIFLSVFTLANVLLITLTVNNSIMSTEEVVLSQFPPIIEINYNYDTYENTETSQKLTLDKVETLYNKSKNIVKSYDYALVKSLERTEDITKSYISDEMMVGDDFIQYLSIYGTQLPFTSLVAKGDATLIDGKGFNEEDLLNGNPVAIVSKQFAEANGLDVGTFFTLENNEYAQEDISENTYIDGDMIYSEEIELEVVGIIEIGKVEDFLEEQSIKESNDYDLMNEIQGLADRIYTPNKFLEPIIRESYARSYELASADEKEFLHDQFSYIIPEFILKDMEYLDEFTTYAQEVYNENDFSINSIVSEYERIAQPLNSMSNLLTFVFKITVISSISIITLILVIFMYFRKKEMGILLALGEKHNKIFVQLMLETLVVALAATTLAVFTSMIFSTMLMDNTIDSLLNFDYGNDIYYGLGFGIEPETIASQYQVSFDVDTIVIFYITIIATVVISQLITMLYLVRLNPKKILM